MSNYFVLRRRFGPNDHVILEGRRRQRVGEGRSSPTAVSVEGFVVDAVSGPAAESRRRQVVDGREITGVGLVVSWLDRDDHVAERLLVAVIVEVMTIPKHISAAETKDKLKKTK